MTWYCKKNIMVDGWKPRPLSELEHDEDVFGPDYDKDDKALLVSYWKNDDESSLEMTYTDDELRVLAERYGVTDELIDWMYQEGLFREDWTINGNDKVAYQEIFEITDEIVNRFYFHKKGEKKDD